ncbi:NACHT domain-containing protein [Tenacibaculum mesophilum]|uniref:NACHT domain-containing protein n=1 Tax=Tenacibaculum mesophilum TaxID=104268 RepID=UPI00248FD20C|nr:hypothetical protein [Tenacibaculum mesophilum]
MENYILTRHLTEEPLKTDRFLVSSNNKHDLMHYVQEHKKVIILGEPGVGKTTELKKLFSDLWEIKSKTKLIPILLKLNSFKKEISFEDLISFKEWEKLPKIIFILDGLDEVIDIEDFLSELEFFTRRHNQLNISFVLSCRSNVYEKYISNIQEFKPLYLNVLSSSETIKLFKEKHNIEEDLSFAGVNIRTPYFIDLLAKFYKIKKRKPLSLLELWDFYIINVISEFNLKYKKDGVSEPYEILNSLKKTAVINELMQTSRISDLEIGTLFSDIIVKKDKPFLVYDSELKDWFFEHKQIQEFLVAKSLSELSEDKILEIINVNGLNKIHPSMFNSVTFLVSLIDENSPIFKWLEINQIEVLIKADSSRIPERIKKKVFKEYFDDRCLEKTFWIGSESISVELLSDFGNFREIAVYLKDILFDENKHRRARISASVLLGSMSSSYSVLKDFYSEFKELLVNEKDIDIKAEVLNAMSKHFSDDKFVDEIFDIFRKEKSKIINKELISLVHNLDNKDKYIDYLEEEFLRIHDIIPREDGDRVIRGNSFYMERILLNLEDSRNFLKIVKHYFNNEYKVSFSNDYTNKILDRCKFFNLKSSHFTLEFFNQIDINERSLIRKFDDFFKDLIDNSINKSKLVKKIIEDNLQKDDYYFIARVLDFEFLDFFVSKVSKSDTLLKRSENIRNYISNTNDLKLAHAFQDRIEEYGVVFKEKLFTEDDIEELKERAIKRRKHNLKILLSKDELYEEIRGVFNGNSVIKQEDIYEIRDKWYDEYGHGEQIDSSIIKIEEVLYHLSKKEIGYEDIVSFYDKYDFKLIENFKNRLDSYKNRGWDFSVPKEEREKIIKWCITTSTSINFENIVNYTGLHSFKFGDEYNKLKLILELRDYYDISLSKKFLLNSLQYIRFEDVNNDSQSALLEIKKVIDDDELFDQYIVEYILNEKNHNNINFQRFIDYAIRNNLDTTFPKIDEYFKSRESVYVNIERLALFSKKYEKDKLLESYCFNINNNLTWRCIDILIDNKNKSEFCVSIAKEYLKQENAETYKSDALRVLLKYSINDAVKLIMDSVQQENYFSLSIDSDIRIQDNPSDLIKQLEKLYYSFYGESIKNRYDAHFYQDFYRKVIVELSKTESYYRDLCEVLQRIKKSLKSEQRDLFYINNLIQLSNNAFLNVKSKPLPFVEAKKIADKIIV